MSKHVPLELQQFTQSICSVLFRANDKELATTMSATSFDGKEFNDSVQECWKIVHIWSAKTYYVNVIEEWIKKCLTRRTGTGFNYYVS